MNDAVEQAFAALREHRVTLDRLTMREIFAEDLERFGRFHAKIDELIVDYSKHKIASETMALLFVLARAAEIESHRQDMFDGSKINVTEHRSVLHVALRNLSGRPILVDGHDIMPAVEAERAKMYAFAEAVRSATVKGATGKPLRHIVNIGIGGSDLGPAMVAEALKPYRAPGFTAHFVSNVDGAHLADTLPDLDPEQTLFVVASKTFTTLETMTNAAAARSWLAQKLGEAAVGDHFAAVSTNLTAVNAFGIAEARKFGFWDWVGGRYSVWSAIGLPVAILIGPERFTEFLAGAHRLDEHFRSAPLEQNVPVILALLGILRRNVFGDATHAILPYDQRLSQFTDYLQQLDMESNGKRVRRDGTPVPEATAPVVWGKPGTNGQHAFFQLLHQGTDVVPADVLIAARAHEPDPAAQELLVANCLAQTEALMNGRTTAEAAALLEARGLSEAEAARLAPHRTFPGDRPTTTILYPLLDPHTLGMLIALYEHKVFVQGVIWGVNSFDQWGVELGKELALRLAPIVASKAEAGPELDSSTRGLLEAIERMRAP